MNGFHVWKQHWKCPQEIKPRGESRPGPTARFRAERQARRTAGLSSPCRDTAPHALLRCKKLEKSCRAQSTAVYVNIERLKPPKIKRKKKGNPARKSQDERWSSWREALTCLHQSCSSGSRCSKQKQGSCWGLAPFILEGSGLEGGGGVKRWARRTSAVLPSKI